MELLKSGETICEINEDLRLIQREGGLKFGTDSYLLSAFIKKNISGHGADLGAGTGVISLFAASRCSFSKIHAIEIQQTFFDLVGRNAALNGLDDMIEPRLADVRDLESLPPKESCSAVFSNPPYMIPGSGKDSATGEMNAARREENGKIDDFCRAASYLLKFGGLFYTVYRPDRAADLIFALKKYSLEPKRMIFVYPDVASRPSLVLTESKKCGAPSVLISRPLIVYDSTDPSGTRHYTKDMEAVYNDFSLDRLFDR